MTPTPSRFLHARDIVVVGCSMDGPAALSELFSRFPATIPAAFFVVQHLGAGYPGDLPGLLAERCQLPVTFAADGEIVRMGHVYVAPADANMVLERGRIVVQRSPRESFHRPSINALFRSAAMGYGRRVVGVVLTGTMEDGVAGAWEIWRRGGIVIVQDPGEARSPALPQRVLASVPVDYTARLPGIAELVVDFATRPRRTPPVAGDFQARVMIVEDERIVAKSLENALQGLHYDVCASEMTGEAAVEAAGRLLPDVILMDIRLSGAMDGTQAASLIWQRFQVPVVYLTAYADAETLAAVKGTNAYGYVMKPYEPAEVHVAVQLALERRDRELVREERVSR
jgi:chemotaxis response regulator CheB